MRHVLVALLMSPTFTFGMDCGMLFNFLASPCRMSVAAWNEGRNEIYFSGYAYHERHTYAADRIRELNERAWGLGFARSVQDADGDTHAIYALAFRDSHFKFQKVSSNPGGNGNVGYVFGGVQF